MKKALSFVESGTRTRWVFLIFLAVCVGALESVGAILLFAVLSVIAGERSIDSLIPTDVLQKIFSHASDDQLYAYAAITVAIFFVIRGIAIVSQTYLQNRIAHNAGVRTATRLLGGYLAMPYQFHLNRNSAELIRNGTESIASIVAYVFLPGLALTSEILLVVGLTIVLFLAAPLVMVTALAILAPLVLILLRVVQPLMQTLGELAERMTRDSLRALQNSFFGLRDIKVLGRERYFQDKFQQSQRELSRSKYLRLTLADAPRVTVETVLVMGLMVVATAAGPSDSAARQSLPLLGLFGYAIFRMMPALNRIVSNLNLLRYGAAAVHHVHRDLRVLQEQPVAPVEKATPLPIRHSITLERASYRYEGARGPAIADIDLTIRKGSSVGVVGPTGGGKSTLIDMIIGLLPATEGRVLVDGVDITACLSRWQASLGVVPQQVFLLDDSLRRNIAFGIPDDEIDDAVVWEVLQLARLDSFVADLEHGVDTVVGERGARVSGGQRQRIAIARALYNNPSVLIFDEGTSALDNVTEIEVVRAINKLRGQRTIITVAHRLSTVRDCDRVILIQDGRLADSGSFEELLERNADFRQLASAG